MTQLQINEFAPSIYRIILRVLSIFHWIVHFFGLETPKNSISNQPAAKSPKDAYIESMKTRFLATYREEDNQEKWNSNIDEVMKDANALSEVLKDVNNEYEKKWRTRILLEPTPRGNVIMFYDLYKRAFSYYCDQAVMPYEIMNAVAMKYVMMFNCRDLFIDSAVLPTPLKQSSSIDSTNEKQDETKTKTVKFDNKAFAKFKTYNNATKKSGILAKDDKTINCFLHLGGTRNWSPITKKKKPNPINGFKTDMMPGDNKTKKLSYLDYKKQTSPQ
jgi:hypothetical protein